MSCALDLVLQYRQSLQERVIIVDAEAAVDSGRFRTFKLGCITIDADVLVTCG